MSSTSARNRCAEMMDWLWVMPESGWVAGEGSARWILVQNEQRGTVGFRDADARAWADGTEVQRIMIDGNWHLSLGEGEEPDFVRTCGDELSPLAEGGETEHGIHRVARVDVGFDVRHGEPLPRFEFKAIP